MFSDGTHGYVTPDIRMYHEWANIIRVFKGNYTVDDLHHIYEKGGGALIRLRCVMAILASENKIQEAKREQSNKRNFVN